MAVGRGVRDRIAAQTAMAVVVAAQADAPPRTPLARLAGISPLVPAARDDYRDALGELIVGDLLENLGHQWDVLHDVPLGAATLDHLLIGPPGVFAVRVANHGDRDVVVDRVLLAGGEPTDDIAEAARQAQLVGERLSAAAGEDVAVTALLVVVGPRRLAVRGAEPGVVVLVSTELERTLAHASRALTGDAVARISDLADLESTWPAPQAQSLDVRELHRAFALVREQARGAFLRRMFWLTVALAVSFVVLWVLVARAVSVILAS